MIELCSVGQNTWEYHTGQNGCKLVLFKAVPLTLLLNLRKTKIILERFFYQNK